MLGKKSKNRAVILFLENGGLKCLKQKEKIFCGKTIGLV